MPQGGLPSDAGVIVMNVTTVSTIGKFLATGMPLVTKRLTVDGDAIKEPKNVEVIIGTPVREVLEFCGLKEGVTVAKLISGGPMMGLALPSDEEPVLKQNNDWLSARRWPPCPPWVPASAAVAASKPAPWVWLPCRLPAPSARRIPRS